MSQLITQVSPHIHDKTTTQRIMLDVIIALCPTAIASAFIFGARALLVIAVCVATAVAGEWAFRKICKRPITICDLSAVVTGMLLAFNLPVDIEIWQAMFGSLVAIIVVKQLFGGIGKNFANPAITARIVMLISFSTTMSRWVLPNGVQMTTNATSLAVLNGAEGELPSVVNMLIGLRGGCIGETCVVTLILGGLYLLIKRVITWHAPLSYMATVFVFAWLLTGSITDATYHLMSGGLVLGAVFMATDYATTPYTKTGKVIFGVGCGIMTMLIRSFGSFPEGVSFSILLMNIITPYINTLTHSRPFGGVKA